MGATRHQWELEWSSEFEEHFSEVPSKIRRQIFEKLEKLLIADDPQRPDGVATCKLDVGSYAGCYRFHQGDLRVIYSVQCQRIVVRKCEYKGIVYLDNLLWKGEQTYR